MAMHPQGPSPSTHAALQRGFSLTELMVVLALVALLVFAALPQLSQAIQNAKERRLQNQLVGDLRLAQSEAKRRGQAITVAPRELDCASSDASEHNWSCGWRVYVDDGDGRYNAASDTLIAESSRDAQTGMTSTRDKLTYTPAGTTSFVQTFTIGQQGLQVKVAWIRISAT